MKKTIRLLVLVLAALFLFAACQSPATETTTTAPAGETTTGAPTDETPDEIVYEFIHTRLEEEMDQNAEAYAFFTHLYAWLDANPHVTINQNVMSQTDYQTRIMALAAADDMPDLYFTKGSWVGNFYRNEVMADLTDYITVADYRPGIFDPFTRDGKIYAVPYQCNVTHVVYYNSEMWADAGFDAFPDNWDDIWTAHEYFQEQGIDTIAFANLDKWNSGSCILSTLGDRFTGTAWTESIVLNDGNAKFTDPEFVAALEWLNEMKELFNDDFNAIQHQQAAGYYINRRAAANIDGIWTMGYHLANADEDLLQATKVAVMPPVPGGKGEAAATSGGPVWSMSVSSKLEGAKMDKAAELTLYLFSEEYSQHVMDSAGMISIHIVEPTDRDGMHVLSQRMLDMVNSLNLVPIYDGQMEASVIEVQATTVQAMLAGDMTPQEVAERIQAEQDRID